MGGTDTRDDMLFLPMSESCIKRICLKTYHILEEEEPETRRHCNEIKKGAIDRVPFDLEKVATCSKWVGEPRATAMFTGRGMKITGNTKAHLVRVVCVWCLKSEKVWLGGWS